MLSDSHKKDFTEKLHNVRKVIFYFDAGTRGGNPGESAIGVYSYIQDDPFGTSIGYTELVGTCTNNVAEWLALIKTLEILLECGDNCLREITIRSDSKLVVHQALGKYQVRGHLRPQRDRAFELCRQLGDRGCSVSITHVRRTENKQADSLVTQRLDEHMGRRRGY